MVEKLADAENSGGWEVEIDGKKIDFSKVEISNPKFGILIELGKRPEGYTGPAIRERGGAVVLPYFRDEKGEIWVGLLKSERPNLGGGPIYEISGGFMETKEDHHEVARREFQEETGVFLEPKQMGSFTAWNRLFQFCDVNSGEGAGTKNQAELPAYLFDVDEVDAVATFREDAPDFFNKKLVFFPWKKAAYKTCDDLAGMAIARLIASLL